MYFDLFKSAYESESESESELARLSEYEAQKPTTTLATLTDLYVSRLLFFFFFWLSEEKSTRTESYTALAPLVVLVAANSNRFLNCST